MSLNIIQNKLQTIAILYFPIILHNLEIYLGITGYLRQYIPYYIQLNRSLQKHKTVLLRQSNIPKTGPKRKIYIIKTLLGHLSTAEKTVFDSLQEILSKFSYLIYYDPERQLYMDIDVSKKREFGAILYYIRGDPPPDNPIASTVIQPILYLSRLLTDAETRYWPTELEIAGLVWVFKKTRHYVDSARKPTIVYIDHASIIVISKQISLTDTICSDKLNLRLVYISEYIQKFDLDIRYKTGKQNIIPDILLRLESLESGQNSTDSESILDTDIYWTEITQLVELDTEFKR